MKFLTTSVNQLTDFQHQELCSPRHRPVRVGGEQDERTDQVHPAGAQPAALQAQLQPHRLRPALRGEQAPGWDSCTYLAFKVFYTVQGDTSAW